MLLKFYKNNSYLTLKGTYMYDNLAQFFVE